ncbi:chemotaxis protein CheB [Rhodoferax sp.]|uniref:chemotaxis protein CheB n=1 Tax=Rhodoferax sp. TaxID=50421 RepID=UPI0027264D3B|nr:chemotaxis protein CheB [Rhodoferax sp.]MDO9198763.1 chemotaxis protein CheB [Rhodoferax sp.]
MKNNDALPASVPFPIVGIGASAGGLVALEQFLSNVPLDSGMAFVIVQHLDPHREGMLVELLQRHTSMPIVEATDQAQVEPDHVYVIPPGRDLSVLNGVLHLLEPPEPRGLRLPIDFFFKSLADDRQQNSMGVILSGMGSDGTLGLRAIRHAAGACFVQTPAEAQFDSMPRSAIDAGVADVVAPADELPGKILAYVGRVQLGAPAETEAEVDQKDNGFLDKVILLLRAQTGHDFSLYKKSTISRRIERRMGLHQLARISDYLRYLRENPAESELLFNELLIGVTSFFRDAPVWEQLKAEVIPALLASHPDGAVLRAWSPGCSTGEEAYSLAMIFKEVIEETRPAHRFSLQIFASDLDKDAISTCRAGVYPRSITSDVPPARLNRFFVEDVSGYRVCNEIREMVIFAEQNLIVDPPFTKLDLLSCRNLLIYLESELQAKLIQLFHYSLNPGGFLVLGSAESVGAAAGLFAPLAGKSRIYRRLDAPARVLPMGFPAAFVQTFPRSWAGADAPEHGGVIPAPNLQMLVDRLVLLRYAPAAVLVTDQGDMLYFSGKTGKYLEPAIGKPSLNLFAMAREGLNQALSEAFHRAVRGKTAVDLKNVKVSGDGVSQYVDVAIQPLEDPPGLRGMALIVFKDVAGPSRRKSAKAAADAGDSSARVQELMQELQHSREEAKSTREEMQTSQEELKSTNEELQSTNEELQSTNEELTTSKEEMQSINEELQTVNHELQAKVTELSRTSNDMKNLLDSTEIATLFLDAALNVRRFTAQTTRIIKLIPGDIGRPITDIVTDLTYPEMVQDAHDVLRTLVFRERDVSTAEGHWFKVRTMPYRTQENRIDGLVITFSDITTNKKLEEELRATQARLTALLENSKREGVVDGLS